MKTIATFFLAVLSASCLYWAIASYDSGGNSTFFTAIAIGTIIVLAVKLTNK